VRVSRNYSVEDWKALSFDDEAHWATAVAIFTDRIETRYLEHIRALLERKTSGFVVLALDCALIETLEQFRRGTRKTPQRKGREYFEAFLTETAFGNNFTKTLAGLFYTEIRCGLLHQSEAGGTSRVKRGGTLPLVSTTTDGTGIVVNTPVFHALLESTIGDYASGLLAGQDVEQRTAFRRKMNFICRVEEKEPSGGVVA
jgi:hypothetical protein